MSAANHADPDDIRVVLCDLDGVVWLAGEPIAGVVDAIAAIRASGRRVLFVTNNSSKTVAAQEDSLGGIGIPARGDVVTSAMAAGALIEPGERVLACGGPGVVEAIEQRGATAVNVFGSEAAAGVSPTTDAVVVGISRDFDYAAMSIAASAIRDGARFIATNTDSTFPTPNGLLPGAGAIVASVATASGQTPEVAGKPHAPAADLVASIAAPNERSQLLMIGDRLETDGAFARQIGCGFALVRSGVTAPDVAIDAGWELTLDEADVAGVAAWLGCG